MEKWKRILCFYFLVAPESLFVCVWVSVCEWVHVCSLKAKATKATWHPLLSCFLKDFPVFSFLKLPFENTHGQTGWSLSHMDTHSQCLAFYSAMFQTTHRGLWTGISLQPLKKCVFGQINLYEERQFSDSHRKKGFMRLINLGDERFGPQNLRTRGHHSSISSWSGCQDAISYLVSEHSDSWSFLCRTLVLIITM